LAAPVAIWPSATSDAKKKEHLPQRMLSPETTSKFGSEMLV
jgi:hypothetical protein